MDPEFLSEWIVWLREQWLRWIVMNNVQQRFLISRRSRTLIQSIKKQIKYHKNDFHMSVLTILNGFYCFVKWNIQTKHWLSSKKNISFCTLPSNDAVQQTVLNVSCFRKCHLMKSVFWASCVFWISISYIVQITVDQVSRDIVESQEHDNDTLTSLELLSTMTPWWHVSTLLLQQHCSHIPWEQNCFPQI